jgi:4'-phosphopantetheinyl transferase
LEFTPAPKHPASPAAEVHVWRAATGAVQGHRILRRVLALYLGEEPEQIAIARGERGKPRLATEPGRLSFNLGHSGELALVAVSRGREVGVDVEREKPGRDFDALAARAFGPEEAAAVRAATGAERTRLFYELWTRLEAGLKCLGGGLAGATAEPAAPVAVENLPIDAGFAAAVAVTGAAVPIRCWTLD